MDFVGESGILDQGQENLRVDMADKAPPSIMKLPFAMDALGSIDTARAKATATSPSVADKLQEKVDKLNAAPSWLPGIKKARELAASEHERVTGAKAKAEEEARAKEIADAQQRDDDTLQEERRYQEEWRAHAEAREDTQNQRAIEDMRKAGINPNLAMGGIGGGGATANTARATRSSEEALRGRQFQELMMLAQQAFQGRQNEKDRFTKLLGSFIQGATKIGTSF